MENLLAIHYWFALYPGGWESSGQWFLYGSLILIVLGIVLQSFIHWQVQPGLGRKLLVRFSHITIATGGFGLLYWFFRAQGVPFFSSRFWLLAIILTDAIWFVFVIRWFIKKQREFSDHTQRAEVYDKYLPGRKG